MQIFTKIEWRTVPIDLVFEIATVNKIKHEDSKLVICKADEL